MKKLAVSGLFTVLIVANTACFRASYTTAGSADQRAQKSQAPTQITQPSNPGTPAQNTPIKTDNDTSPAIDIVITGFHDVIPGKIYRGARPERAGMEALSQLRIKTDIDLENDDDAVAAEQKDAAELGIGFISKPMSGFWTPDDDEVNEVISLMEDQRNYPLYVHCQHGQDRTGMIVGVFEVSAMGATPEAAYEQAVDLGFHWALLPLYEYFQDKMDTAYSLLHPGN